jgi:hypothetical protein
MNWVPMGFAPVVLATNHLPRVCVLVGADAVMLANLGSTQAREERLGLVRVARWLAGE